MAAGAGAFALHACGRAEAEPRPDPQAVVTYLAQIEAREAEEARAARDHRKASAAKGIRRFVEGAAVRAPSDAVINRIENSVVSTSG